jgi:hypothetical protein
LRALALGLQVVVMVAATVATAEELQELPELVLDLATWHTICWWNWWRCG